MNLIYMLILYFSLLVANKINDHKKYKNGPINDHIFNGH